MSIKTKIAALALATLAVTGRCIHHAGPGQAAHGVGAGLVGAAIVGTAIAASGNDGYY